jgi:hypothetical protein
MFRFLVCGFLASTLVSAHPPFTFMIGSPVASQDFQFKTAAFIFRTEGCSEPANPEVHATAEGLVNGARRSVPLNVVATKKPGVFAVFQQWPQEGRWVVNLKGACDHATAGAVVPVIGTSFIRESAKFFSRAATEKEINAALESSAERVSK